MGRGGNYFTRGLFIWEKNVGLVIWKEAAKKVRFLAGWGGNVQLAEGPWDVAQKRYGVSSWDGRNHREDEGMGWLKRGEQQPSRTEHEMRWPLGRDCTLRALPKAKQKEYMIPAPQSPCICQAHSTSHQQGSASLTRDPGWAGPANHLLRKRQFFTRDHPIMWMKSPPWDSSH